MPDAEIKLCSTTGLPIYVEPDTGLERRLGCLEPSADELGLLRASTIPSIDPNQWAYVTHEECKARIDAYLANWLLDQLQHGSCVGASGAGALQYDLVSIGLPPPGKLSLAYVYAWINGNRDGGANIVSALNALQRHGTCLESTVGVNTIYRRQMPPGADTEAQRFRLETGMPIGPFETVVSAGQIGKPVQFGIQVGRNFGNFDNEGICGYGGRGSNHSVWAFPLLVKKADGTPKVPMINSWGEWGPYGTGWCYVDDRHIDGGGGGFIHGTPTYDPQRPPLPRVP